MEIGAQLYTVREFMQSPENISLSLRKIADIGYRYVQLSGQASVDTEWMKSELDKNGLRCVITHTKPDRLQNDPDGVAKEHSILGCDYVGLGSYPFHSPNHPDYSFDAYEALYRPVARALRSRGKTLMHHNHAREFVREDGELIFQKIAERFAPDELGFILDTYWVQRGGCDPAEWIERLKGRVPCIHLKDYAYLPSNESAFAVIGEGNINFLKVFSAAENAGTKYMLVEQDDCYGRDPFDCLRKSYEYLHSFGF